MSDRSPLAIETTIIAMAAHIRGMASGDVALIRLADRFGEALALQHGAEAWRREQMRASIDGGRHVAA